MALQALQKDAHWPLATVPGGVMSLKKEATDLVRSDVDVQPHPNAVKIEQWKNTTLSWMDGKIALFVTMAATLYALFAFDLYMAVDPSLDIDGAMYTCTFVVLILFFSEFCILCWAQKGSFEDHFHNP